MRRKLVTALLVSSALLACKAGIGAPCTSDVGCSDSYCNGAWPEHADCKVDSDCPGYIEVRGGSRDIAPNKRCVDGVCHQVGRCERDHS
jgi:hypothetical protein